MPGVGLGAGAWSVLVVALIAGGQGAIAQTAASAQEASRNRLNEFVSANPTCREMSDNCQVCIVATGTQPECSTPGIACMPAAWQCRKKTDAPLDSDAKPKR